MAANVPRTIPRDGIVARSATEYGMERHRTTTRRLDFDDAEQRCRIVFADDTSDVSRADRSGGWREAWLRNSEGSGAADRRPSAFECRDFVRQPGAPGERRPDRGIGRAAALLPADGLWQGSGHRRSGTNGCGAIAGACEETVSQAENGVARRAMKGNRMSPMTPRTNLSPSQKVFRGLLSVLPSDFRANFGHEMESVFAEQRRDIEERGGWMDILKLWWETFLGIFSTAPREHWDILKQDCAYAVRMMRKNVGFTVIAVLTLALGIGANTAIFSVVHAVLLRPLPYPEGQQLVFVRQQAQREGIDDIGFSVDEIQDYREQNRTLSGLVEYHNMSFILFGHGDPDRVRVAVVSANYFDLFGVKPLLGRTFLASDDTLGAPPVLMLSYDYWRTNFGSDPDIVGQTFELNDKVHTVVGVLPPVPQYPVESDVFMPTSACPFRSAKTFIENRDSRMMEAFARVKPGVSIAEARADLTTISGRLRSQYPKSYPEQMGYAAVTSPLREELTHDARPTLLILLAAAAFVLLIACANVANLTLARTSRRERELAVRTALGAGRSRLLRQLLTESLILAIMGGLLALVFASNSLELLADFAARLTPRAHEIRMDTDALVFTLVAALGTSVLFGTLAALFSRANLTSGLKQGTSGTGRRKNRVRDALIVSQIAFSFILLIGAGLMLRSLQKLLTVDAGF